VKSRSRTATGWSRTQRPRVTYTESCHFFTFNEEVRSVDNKDFGVIAGKLRSNAYDPKELLWASRLEGDRPIDDLTAGQLLQLEEIASGPWLGAKRLRLFLYPEDLVGPVDEADPRQ
jgi:hypothetical protein